MAEERSEIVLPELPEATGAAPQGVVIWVRVNTSEQLEIDGNGKPRPVFGDSK